MNRIIVLILSSLLILGSCGVKHNNSDSNDSKKSESKTENKNKESKSKEKNQENGHANSNENSNNKTNDNSQNKIITDSQKGKRNNENKQNTQSQQTAQNNTQKDYSNQFNNDMPVAHDGGQNGYGYGDYLAAKEASEKARRGELQGVGGSWGVAPGQDFNSWRDQQAEIQNEHIAPDE
ncbi:hypothetical protein [Nocardia sp. NPDC003305]